MIRFAPLATFVLTTTLGLSGMVLAEQSVAKRPGNQPTTKKTPAGGQSEKGDDQQSGQQGDKQNGQSGEQGEKQNNQSGQQGEHQNGQSGEQGEHQNGQTGEQGDKSKSDSKGK